MLAAFSAALLVSLLAATARGADYNIINLDNATLPLLVGQDLPAFVRFDKDYPHGDKADAFKELAASAVGAQVLIATVGISTYGDKMNQDIALKFGYKKEGKDLEHTDLDKEFPKFRFFPAKGGKDFEYKGAVKTDAMMMFLKTKAKVYFGLKGTLKDFDKLAAEFVKATDKGEVVTRTKAAADALTSSADKEVGAYYLKAMEKSVDSASSWFSTEFERLKKMIDGGKVTPQKKETMQLKINRLSSFVSPNDEL
mmetsp:Transcript_99450/g.197069  ORF Transcript_99450/g.197069 Transcript_99450/m.197069 type:complete len:254 (+) Transcript_99450:55-816(+)|eukprot:CAMPEP_0172716676 /NCGR_PEP_ID=MMETSP1074-20121228/69161_1 /TAXON_ID=2916 /ORGANISM="Ceratium fusus, Strain PA161109" /LENGTH=253 /DNA_ID=CAMNT_0013541437 /DNA_START=57 /DNA_END=818 /DNA_ORIENTATION=+